MVNCCVCRVKRRFVRIDTGLQLTAARSPYSPTVVPTVGVCHEGFGGVWSAIGRSCGPSCGPKGILGKNKTRSAYCHAGFKGLVRPKGLEPLLQAPEACVISTSPRAQLFA